MSEPHHVMFLDAPTATGKTLLAYALHRLTKQPAFAVTWSRALQLQYIDQLGVPRIMGRGNFQCARGRYYGFDTCEWNFCEEDPSCPFQQQFQAGLWSPFTVLNYALLFTYRGGGKLTIPSRPWLICDEGHVLEDALGQALDVYLSREWFEQIEFPDELPPHGNREALEKWSFKVVTSDYSSPDGQRDILWRRAKNLAQQTMTALKDHERIISDDGLVVAVRTLWPLHHIREALLDDFPNILIMSATMGDMDYLAKQMGLAPDDYSSLAVPSAIPVEQRLIYILPTANLKHSADDLDYQAMACAIMNLAEGDFQHRKGLVHVSAYRMARRLGKLLQEKLGDRVLVEDRRDPAIRDKWIGQTAGILVTPSAGLGMDYPFLFDWQIIAKLPYPDLSDPVIRTRLNLDSGWYVRQTANRVVQMAGRVARTSEDEGVTVVLDSSFDHNLFSRAPEAFPDWFTEALRWQLEE